MLNQPKSRPSPSPSEPEVIPKSNIRARADDVEYQRELAKIEREMEYDYD